MKKIILTLVLVVAFTTTYGQNKYQERQSKYFVEAAAKEFNLNDNQQESLKEYRTTMVLAYGKSQKNFKAGAITKVELKSSNRETSKVFHNKVIKMTGKTYKELAPFLKRMREELKKVK